jgi:hypothetical protein
MKLISMTDFVLLECNYNQINIKYAKFLKQPKEIWMFVPCDEDGNVLEKPKIENMPFCSVNGEGYDYAILKYEQAKERVLFERFKLGAYPLERFVLHDNPSFGLVIDSFKEETIEDLVRYDLTLTQTAIKQIGL